MIKSTDELPPMNTPIIYYKKYIITDPRNMSQKESPSVSFKILRENEVKYWTDLDGAWMKSYDPNDVFYWDTLPDDKN